MSGATLTSVITGRLSIALSVTMCGYAVADSLTVTPGAPRPIAVSEPFSPRVDNPFGILKIESKPRSSGSNTISTQGPFERLRQDYFTRILRSWPAATENPVWPDRELPRLPFGCEPLGAKNSELGRIAGRCLS